MVKTIVAHLAAGALLATGTLQTAAAAHGGSAARSARPPDRTLRVPILMYHRIGVPAPSAPAITHRLTVHHAHFARQMRWLRRHGYRSISQRQLLGALHGRTRLPRRPVVVTFDDGYRDVLLRAAPVLERLEMRAIAYVITGRALSGGPDFLTYPMMRTLERRGVEIGSHTVSHRDLTTSPDPAALAELRASRRALERRLRHPVRWLAYPYGGHDARVVRLARRAGYLLAVTTREGFMQSSRAPLELRRIRVLDSTGVQGLAALLAAG